jgi:hypothetical protein
MGKYKDPVEIARDVFDQFLSIADPESVQPKQPEPNDPKKVAAGKIGGKAGGPARAKALSPSRRKRIAEKASKARWKPE